jgi:hypothetical protein
MLQYFINSSFACFKVNERLVWKIVYPIVYFDFSSCILHFLRSIQLETSKRVDLKKKRPLDRNYLNELYPTVR